MTRQYSIKNFLRRMPKPFLGRYFEEKNLFSELNFLDMDEGSPENLFLAWEALPDEKRQILDVEFRQIFNMSCKKGTILITDTAKFYLPEPDRTIFVEKLASLRNAYECAMLTFLDWPQLWQQAQRVQYVDNLSTHWHLRMNFPHQAPAIDGDSLRQLSDAIRQYFHTTEGRGNNCFVEYFRRGNLDCFLAYPEDHSAYGLDWSNNKLNTRPHNPPFEIVFMYSKKQGSLNLNFEGSNKVVEALQSMFAKTILKIDMALLKNEWVKGFSAVKN